MFPSFPKIKVDGRMVGQSWKRTFRSIKHRSKISASLAEGSNFVGLQHGIDINIEVRIFNTSHFAFRVTVGPALKVFLC